MIGVLQGRLRGLVGKECWYASSGGAAGPTFQLAFGGKIRRPSVLENPAHSIDFRRFEGEVSVLVWCSWRLDGPDRPLVSSDDPAKLIDHHLGGLVGARVSDFTLSQPGFDLSLAFSNNCVLHVFCDHVSEDASFDGNWELWDSTLAIIVGRGGKLEVEDRASIQSD